MTVRVYEQHLAELRSTVFDPSLEANKSGWDYETVLLTAQDALSSCGLTTDPIFLMDDEGRIDLVGAFAIGIGVDLKPGRNEAVYDILQEWLLANPVFRQMLAEALRPGVVHQSTWNYVNVVTELSVVSSVERAQEIFDGLAKALEAQNLVGGVRSR